MQRDL
jgi:hypothetical protein